MAVAPLGELMNLMNRQWPWFAILARTNREKHATMLLENSGFECFLPTSKSTRKWSDRMKEVEEPLFPGYLFCRMNPNDRLPVLTTPGVIQIAGIGKMPIPVEEHEITAIKQIQKSGLAATPWPYLRVGNTAKIDEGPLRGLAGIVVRIKSTLKLVLSVELLQRSIAVEIDRNWITPCSPAELRRQSTARARSIVDLADPAQPQSLKSAFEDTRRSA